MKVFEFSNSQKAYDGINEYFLNEKEDIEKSGGGRYGGQMVLYDNYIFINKAWVKPSFDFGNMFGYRAQKWGGLVKNYVDLLDLGNLAKRVQTREAKKTKNYNESMVFHNKHGHGKGCLLSLTCTRRQDSKYPIITVTLRSSEVTKRLLMDMLLVQRIAEMIYESWEIRFSLNIHIINMYQNAEAFTMFDNHIPIKGLVKNKGEELNVWQAKVIKLLDYYKTCNIDEVKMKVHKRCVRQLQRPNGIPLSGDRPMLAKNLQIL